MCIHMLTKRTNILFNEELFNHLVALANKNSTSVGDLVRKAVIKVYWKPEQNQGKIKAFKEIIRLKKGLGRISSKEIKEMINYGRRY